MIRFQLPFQVKRGENLGAEDTFSEMIDSIRQHFLEDAYKLEDFILFYEKALLFMKIKEIFPNKLFVTNRINFIGRNLAFSIFFAMHHMYEEAQILLRQVLDIIFILLYGLNRALELDEIDRGKIDQIGSIRSEVERKLPQEFRDKLKKLYRKLSNVVHGTVKDILTNVVTLKEKWENPAKLGHWKHDFSLTLELALCLCKSWLPMQYARLDLLTRSKLEEQFPKLGKI